MTDLLQRLRQRNPKCGSFAGFRSNLDMPLVLFDDPEDDGEAQSGPLSNILGSKKWIEDMLPHSVGHPYAGIRYLYHNMIRVVFSGDQDILVIVRRFGFYSLYTVID